MKEYTKLAKETSNPPFSVFVDAYKKGLISKNRLASIGAIYNKMGRRLSIIIDRPERKDPVMRNIKEMEYRLQERADEIYGKKKEPVPLEQREYVTVRESVALAKEKGYNLNTTALYKHINKGEMQTTLSELGILLIKPKDVISLCKDIEASRNEIKRPAILDKLKDETLIEEIKRRGYEIR